MNQNPNTPKTVVIDPLDGIMLTLAKDGRVIPFIAPRQEDLQFTTPDRTNMIPKGSQVLTPEALEIVFIEKAKLAAENKDNSDE